MTEIIIQALSKKILQYVVRNFVDRFESVCSRNMSRVRFGPADNQTCHVESARIG